MPMILQQTEVTRCLERVREAFPRFENWQYTNEENTEYSGFTLWGELIADAEDVMPRRFFVTFDTFKESWRGHLTIGQHAYFWSSADFGDAYLVDTDECDDLDEAIGELKKE